MPFDDEVSADGVAVVPYRDGWADEAAALTAWLSEMMPASLAVEHIGSTSIRGMAAKDCLDMMIVVEDLDGCGVQSALSSFGYRRRPESWNNVEDADGQTWPKMVFAPPVGGRPVNIHVRTVGSAPLRVALLFRDHLRADPERTRRWSQFKTEASLAASDLAGYGRIKLPAWYLLMELAETWAAATSWHPPSYGT